MMAAVRPSLLARPRRFYSKSHPLFGASGSRMQVPNDLHVFGGASLFRSSRIGPPIPRLSTGTRQTHPIQSWVHARKQRGIQAESGNV